MAAFLSDEWLAELAGELRAASGLEAGPALALGQVVTGFPALEGADLAYTVRIGGGEAAAVIPGSVEGADVVLVEDYETARAIASGRPAAELLSEGRVKVRGDATALIGAQESLTALGDALTRLAATTHFEESASEHAEHAGEAQAARAIERLEEIGRAEAASSAAEDGPVLERAMIEVVPGMEAAFVAAFPEARAVILSADGCRSARLLRGVESPSTFLLLVEWDSLAAHMHRFRESPLFVEWRRVLGPYFAGPPLMEHYSLIG